MKALPPRSVQVEAASADDDGRDPLGQLGQHGLIDLNRQRFGGDRKLRDRDCRWRHCKRAGRGKAQYVWRLLVDYLTLCSGSTWAIGLNSSRRVGCRLVNETQMQRMAGTGVAEKLRHRPTDVSNKARRSPSDVSVFGTNRASF
jgi:hypothetical protein